MIYKILIKLVSDIFEAEPAELGMDTSFYEDLSADSLDMYELILACEEEFEAAFTQDAAALEIDTIGDAVRYIAGMVGDRFGE